MKRIGHIYEKMIDVENCKQAIIKASKGKRNRKEVLKILNDLEFYAKALSFRLRTDYFISPYKERVITDGLSGKQRELLVPKFYPDQCAHHAIMNVLMPIVENFSYRWSCANMKGRGMDGASKHITRTTMRVSDKQLYCLKCDIKKFFPSVSHIVLKNKIRHKIKDTRALHLLDLVIDSVDKGIPIGNYTSPAFAEFMLYELDELILADKSVLSYTRYADDIVVISGDKQALFSLLQKIMDKLESDHLRLKENYQIFPVMKDGKGRKIDFVGKCYAIGYTTVRKRRALAFMRQSRFIQRSNDIAFKTASGFISRCNLFRYTNSFGLKRKYLYPINIKKLKEVIRNESYRLAQSRGNNLSINIG